MLKANITMSPLMIMMITTTIMTPMKLILIAGSVTTAGEFISLPPQECKASFSPQENKRWISAEPI